MNEILIVQDLIDTPIESTFTLIRSSDGGQQSPCGQRLNTTTCFGWILLERHLLTLCCFIHKIQRSNRPTNTLNKKEASVFNCPKEQLQLALWPLNIAEHFFTRSSSTYLPFSSSHNLLIIIILLCMQNNDENRYNRSRDPMLHLHLWDPIQLPILWMDRSPRILDSWLSSTTTGENVRRVDETYNVPSLAVHCLRVCNMISLKISSRGGCWEILWWSMLPLIYKLSRLFYGDDTTTADLFTLSYIRGDILSWSHMFYAFLNSVPSII